MARKRYLTPVCPARWPWLQTPDKKWKKEGEYKVDLTMSIDQAKAIYAQVLADVNEQVVELQRTKEWAAWKPLWPIKDELSDDEPPQPTGMKAVLFRQSARIVRDGQDDILFRVEVLDAKQRQIPSTVMLGSGTEMRLSFNVRVVPDKLNKCFRVKFHPLAAQIVKLVEWKQDYGFEPMDGYEAEEGEHDASDVPDDPFSPTAPVANKPLTAGGCAVAFSKQAFRLKDVKEIGEKFTKMVKAVFPVVNSPRDLMPADLAILLDQMPNVTALGEYVVAPDLSKPEFTADEIPI